MAAICHVADTLGEGIGNHALARSILRKQFKRNVGVREILAAGGHGIAHLKLVQPMRIVIARAADEQGAGIGLRRKGILEIALHLVDISGRLGDVERGHAAYGNLNGLNLDAVVGRELIVQHSEERVDGIVEDGVIALLGVGLRMAYQAVGLGYLDAAVVV